MATAEGQAWMLAFACLHHALYAGRMHRLDERFAGDRPIAHLLYVLALFQTADCQTLTPL